MKITAIFLSAAMCLLGAGCADAPQASGEIAVSQDRFAQGGPGSPQPDDPLPGAAAPEETGPGQPQDDAGTDAYGLAALETAVDDIVAKVAAAAPAGDAQSDRAAFQELHRELEEVENRVDLAEDALEADVRSGVLSHSDCRALEARLDELDALLERAEDQLEFAFAMDS